MSGGFAGDYDPLPRIGEAADHFASDLLWLKLAASMQVLCDHPDQLALLRDQPELAMRAVEETMRHSPSMCSTVRSVTDDVTIDDYTFPAGTSSW